MRKSLPASKIAAYSNGLLEGFNVKFVALSTADAFRAGQAFRPYRRKVVREHYDYSRFPDRCAGSSRGWPILTRDPKRFSSYFPEVELIDPLKVEP